MKKIFYVSVAFLMVASVSSCSKKCVVCEARDANGNVLNKSNEVCNRDFQRKQFEDRYKENFKGYVATCYEVQ